MDPDEMAGTIVTIQTTKGFFFVRGSDGVEYFAHKSALQNNVRIGQLKEGDLVTFFPGEHPRGPRANSVVVDRFKGHGPLDGIFA
jgi:cold shock CspA family protein